MRNLHTIRALVVCALLGASLLGFNWPTPTPAGAEPIATSPRAIGAPTIQTSIEGEWNGTLDVGVARFRLVLHIMKEGETFTATLDSPDQGATGLKIDSFNVTQTSLGFEMSSLGATYEGAFNKDRLEIQGQFKQQGQSFPLTFKHATTGAATEAFLKLRKVDVDGHSLNLRIGGTGTPAVILEGGFGVGIASWSPVQEEIAAFAQTVSYDRAGLGQSDAGPKPRDAKHIALELHTALQKAGIKPPYVLVGHSLGGIFVRVFADQFPREVVGLVLIDPSQEAFEEWTRSHPSAKRKDEEAMIAKAPEGPRAEWNALTATYSQARTAKIPDGIPVILLSATEDETMPEEARRVWIEKHEEWLAKIPGAKHIIVEKSGHFIQGQHPALVIDAVKQVVNHPRN